MTNDIYSQITIDNQQTLSGAITLLSTFAECVKKIDLPSEQQLFNNASIMGDALCQAIVSLNNSNIDHQETPISDNKSVSSYKQKIKDFIELKFIYYNQMFLGMIAGLFMEFGIDYVMEIIRFFFKLFFLIYSFSFSIMI